MKKKDTLIVMVFMVLIIMVLMNFFKTNDGRSQQRILKVVGQGKIKILPNQVEFSITSEFVNPTLQKSVKQVNQVMEQIHTICSKYISNPNYISTNRVVIDKSYRWVKNVKKFIGYRASQTIEVILDDITKFENLTEKLLGTKISSFNNIRFTHSQADSLLSEADMLALDDAKLSAIKISKRSGVSLGEIKMITNYQAKADRNGLNLIGEAHFYNKGNSSGGFSILPKTLEFTKNIYVQYVIE